MHTHIYPCTWVERNTYRHKVYYRKYTVFTPNAQYPSQTIYAIKKGYERSASILPEYHPVQARFNIEMPSAQMYKQAGLYLCSTVYTLFDNILCRVYTEFLLEGGNLRADNFFPLISIDM